MLIVLQLGLPLLLTAWLWRFSSGNRLVLSLQFAAVGSVIIALWTVGLWTSVPRWGLAIVGILALVGAVSGARRPASPLGSWGWLQSVISVALLIIGLAAIAEAWHAHQPPTIASIRLAMPVDGNDLVVANGGSRLLLNAHQDTLDLSTPRHRLWLGQSYGVDIVAIRPSGITSDGLRPANPRRYAIFGRALHAPCTGTATAVRDDKPDLDVPKVDDQVMTGNQVTLRCNGIEVVMAHLKRGSVLVCPGQQVAVGETIASVGNSGMSDEPHLHIHAQTPGTAQAPFSGKPVAIFFNGRFLARNDRI